MRPAATAILVLCAAGAAGAEVKAPKCFSPAREGHCIAVTLNGQASTRLSKQARKLLEPIGGLRFGGDTTRYEVATPLRGALDVQATFVPGASEYFGAPPELDVHVRPLEGQGLDTRAELSTAPTVRAEGGAVVTRSDVVQDNRLPPGKYLLSVALRGSRNWDRQTLYFQVAE